MRSGKIYRALYLPRIGKAPILLAKSCQLARLGLHGSKVHVLCPHRADKADALQLLKDLKLLRIFLRSKGFNNLMLFPIGTIGWLKRRIQRQLRVGGIEQGRQPSQHAIRNLRNDIS